MRVSFTVKVSVRVIQVAILSGNCEATQPRRTYISRSELNAPDEQKKLMTKK